MAGREMSLDMEGLAKWEQWLLKLSGHGKALDDTKSRILRSAALRLQEHLDDLTPVRSAVLQNSMRAGDRSHVFQLQVGSTSYVFVGTAVKYAAFVNDGFTQKRGQYVPGYWSGGTFHYDRESEGGMVLTGKVIPGAHMFEKAMDLLEGGDLQKIKDYEFRRLYQQLFEGG